MEQELIAKLIQAVETIQNPLVSSEQRQLAQKFCDDWKQSSPTQCVLVGTELARPNYSPVVRHFGLSLLEFAVKDQWAKFPAEQKQQLKTHLLTMVSSGTLPMLQEQKFIKEKLVKVVAEIILRQYPQMWLDLIPSLIAIAKLGETQAELVILIIKSFAEELYVYFEGLPTLRRRELSSGLQGELPQIFAMFYSLLETNYTIIVQASAQTPPPDTKVNMIFLEHILEALKPFLDSASVQTIFDFKFPAVLCQLLQMQSKIKMAAAECILLIVNRKGTKPEEKTLLLFPFDNIQIFETAMIQAQNHFDEDEYRFHKALCQILATTGCSQLGMASKDIPNNYQKFIQLCLEYFNHPSLSISNLTIPMWTMMVAHKTVATQPFFQEIYLKLLQILERKLIKFDPFREKTDPALKKFALMDFDSRNEYVSFLGLSRSQLLVLLKGIMTAKPDACLEYISSELVAAMSQVPENERLLEALVTMFDFAMLTFGEAQLSENLIRISEAMLKRLLDYQAKESTVMLYVLDTLRSFYPYYKSHPNTLEFVFKKIFDLITFITPGETLRNMTGNTVSLRRRACTTLISVCGQLPQTVLPFLPRLVEITRQLFANNVLLEAERIYILDALAATSTSMPNVEEHLQFLAQLVSQAEADWSSPEVTSTLTSAATLIKEVAFTPSNRPGYLLSDIATKMHESLNSLAAVWKRAAAPVPVAHLAKLVPNVLSLVRLLHSLWDNDTRLQLQLPPAILPIFAIDESMKDVLLKTEEHKNDESTYHNDKTKALRGWLEHMRTACYNLMEPFSKQEQFYSIDNEVSVLGGSLFAYLDQMENRHLKIFVRNVITPLVSRCPPQRFAILAALMPPFLQLMYSRLQNSWRLHTSSEVSFKNSEKDEVIENTLLRDVTFEYLKWLSAALSVNNDGNQKVETAVAPPLAELFLTEPLGVPMLYSFIGALYWPDSQSFHRALTSCTVLVPKILRTGNVQFLTLLGEMLIAALKAYSTKYLQEYHAKLLSLIRELYVRLTPISNVAASVFMSLPCSIQQLEELNKSLAAVADEKKQKKIFQSFLASLGLKTLTLKITDLPPMISFDPNGANNAQSAKIKPSWQDQAEDLGMQKIFQQV